MLAWPGSFLSGSSLPPAQCEPSATRKCAIQHPRSGEGCLGRPQGGPRQGGPSGANFALGRLGQRGQRGRGKAVRRGERPGRMSAIPDRCAQPQRPARRGRAPDGESRRQGLLAHGLGRAEGRAAAGGSGTQGHGQTARGPLGAAGGRPVRAAVPGTGLSGVSGERAGPLGRARKAGHPRKNPEKPGDSQRGGHGRGTAQDLQKRVPGDGADRAPRLGLARWRNEAGCPIPARAGGGGS